MDKRLRPSDEAMPQARDFTEQSGIAAQALDIRAQLLEKVVRLVAS